MKKFRKHEKEFLKYTQVTFTKFRIPIFCKREKENENKQRKNLWKWEIWLHEDEKWLQECEGDNSEKTSIQIWENEKDYSKKIKAMHKWTSRLLYENRVLYGIKYRMKLHEMKMKILCEYE